MLISILVTPKSIAGLTFLSATGALLFHCPEDVADSALVSWADSTGFLHSPMETAVWVAPVLHILWLLKWVDVRRKRLCHLLAHAHIAAVNKIVRYVVGMI